MGLLIHASTLLLIYPSTHSRLYPGVFMSWWLNGYYVYYITISENINPHKKIDTQQDSVGLLKETFVENFGKAVDKSHIMAMALQ